MESVSTADDSQHTLQANITNRYVAVNGNGNGNSNGIGKGDSAPIENNASLDEEETVQSLILAHRVRSPVAVAVTPSYVHTPFKVTKDILGLGWFWIVDAWTEIAERQPPHSQESEKHVVWRFHLEWCTGQPEPWWSPRTDEDRIEPVFDVSAPDEPEVFRKSNVATTTLRGKTGDPSLPHRTLCGACDRISTDVYDQAMCLNEACAWMCRERLGNCAPSVRKRLTPRTCSNDLFETSLPCPLYGSLDHLPLGRSPLSGHAGRCEG